MHKKHRLYLVISILSFLSLIIAITLKLNGTKIFDLNINPYTPNDWVTYISNTIILIFQYILIVGCIVRYKLKELTIKLIPYMPLVVILYFLPTNVYFILNCIILFVTCISLKPKFSTIVLFIVNIFIISLLQLLLLWLKLDIKNVMPISLGFIDFFVFNLDQFILLGLLYFINRKWGEKYD